jgi:hypothetical protein
MYRLTIKVNAENQAPKVPPAITCSLYFILEDVDGLVAPRGAEKLRVKEQVIFKLGLDAHIGGKYG